LIPESHRAGKTASHPPRAAMTREQIFALIGDKLALVNERFDEEFGSNVEIVSTMGRHVAGSGGKRLRPALLLLASGACGYEGVQDVLFAAALELIHTATLVHDDIIDEATIRRGRESLNHRWGNHLTVLMGDHLYITAMQLAIEGQNFRILSLLAETTLGMIEGEMIQKDQNGRLDIDENEHLEVVRRKTAMLFSTCCRVPAMLSPCTPEQQRALENYGLDLGMAYQLIDDLLDFTADEETLGKPTVNDLREGKLTLPLIYLLRRGDPRHVELVRTVMTDRGFARVPREAITGLLREQGCLEEGRETAIRYAVRARGHLDLLPESRYKDALHSVLDFVIERDR
jgi:octaprenyl-diphosphate synthase